MIVRDMPDGQVLCILQTSHGLMAEEFCRYWGNDTFAKPEPYTQTMMAISQHDNGWIEWEQQPQLREDGYPMDFMHGPDVPQKVQLWWRGIHRAYAQHPYASILVGRHAAHLYQASMDEIQDPESQAHAVQFIADQDELVELVRAQLADCPETQPWLTEERIESNTRLLQFGDGASLQVSVPWSDQRTFSHCPLDGEGEYVSIQMRFNDELITFDPWPYHVPEFTVSMEGWLLPERIFVTEDAYHTALAEAPFYRHTWVVAPEIV